MASTHPPHLPFAPTHTPTTATFLILISVCVVPFVALSSSELIPTTLPTAASTLLNSVLSVATSFPFYFFLLNLLIVALIFLSGVFDRSSTSHRFADLQEGDLHRRNYFSAAHNDIQESLALNQFYETQGPSPSYLGFVEGSSSVCVMDETQGNKQANGDDEGEKVWRKKITSLLENPVSSNDDKCRDNVTFSASDNVVKSASETHSTNAFDRMKLEVMARTAAIEISIVKSRLAVSSVSSLPVNDQIADLHHEVILDGDETISLKDVQDSNGPHREYGDMCKNAEDAVIHGERDNITDNYDGDVANGSDVLPSVHDNGDEKLGFQASDAGNCDVSQPQILALPMGEINEQGKVRDVEDGDVTSAMARNPDEEEAEEAGEGKGGASEGDGQEGGLKQHEQGEELSREELNQRASAFISAFRKKLISTASE